MLETELLDGVAFLRTPMVKHEPELTAERLDEDCPTRLPSWLNMVEPALHAWVLVGAVVVHTADEILTLRLVEQDPGAGRGIPSFSDAIEPRTYALRACRVRDGGRWSERSSAGSCFRVDG